MCLDHSIEFEEIRLVKKSHFFYKKVKFAFPLPFSNSFSEPGISFYIYLSILNVDVTKVRASVSLKVQFCWLPQPYLRSCSENQKFALFSVMIGNWKQVLRARDKKHWIEIGLKKERNEIALIQQTILHLKRVCSVKLALKFILSHWYNPSQSHSETSSPKVFIFLETKTDSVWTSCGLSLAWLKTFFPQ